MTRTDPDEVEHIPSEAASTYAKVAGAYGREYYQSVADLVASELTAGDRLLDVGTGPGFLPIAVADRADPARIDAFDYTYELVQYGHTRARQRGVDDRVSFFVADCYTVPVADRTYTHLSCTGVLHALERPVEALTEFYRVLRPGGTAWVFDPAIIDLPDEPDVDLTDHEQQVLESYGVRVEEDQPSVSLPEAERIVGETPFAADAVDTGEYGDVRFHLTRPDDGSCH